MLRRHRFQRAQDNGSRKQEFQSRREYNRKGYLNKELFCGGDGSVSRVCFTKYDVNDNKTETIFQNPKGGLISSLICHYDDEGKEIGCIQTTAHGLITKQKTLPAYDRTGKKTEETWRYEDGSLNRKHTYKYHLNGMLSEQIIYKYTDDGSLDESCSSTYDENGRIIESTCLDANSRRIEGLTKYKYDERGNEIEAATFNTQGNPYSTTVYSYTFDSLGNWIRQTEESKIILSDFEIRSVTYRAVTYY